MSTEVDVAIVGNGAVGCAIAFVLAEAEPDAKVALVGPRMRPGSASVAAPAMLNVFAEVEPGALERPAAKKRLEAAAEASRAWDAHLERVNARAGTRLSVLRGTYVVSHEEKDAQLDAIAAALRAYGEPFQEIDPSAVPGLRPRTPARRVLFLENEGVVRSRDLHAAYDEAFARTRNVTVIDDEVVSIDRRKNLLLRARGSVVAKTVVLAAGARTQALVDELRLGAKIPRLVFGCGVAVVVDAHVPAADKVLRTTGEVIFTVPYGERRAYVGSTYHESDAPTPLPRVGDVAQLVSHAAQRLDAELGGAEVKKVLTGYRPVTTDGLPLVGATSLDGIWIASGTKRDGFHLSPVIARELVRCLATKEQPFDGVFRPERA